MEIIILSDYYQTISNSEKLILYFKCDLLEPLG